MRFTLALLILLITFPLHADEFRQLRRIRNRVVRQIIEVADGEDYWQSPAQTVKRGAGDCEDHALLILYRAKEQGITAMFVIVKREPINHVVIGYKGRYLDSTTMSELRAPPVTRSFTYAQAIRYAGD